MKTEDVLEITRELVEKRIQALPQIVEPPKLDLPDDGDEEVQVLMLSDLQIGHKTPSTTSRVIRNRMERLRKATVKIARLHRKAYPVRKLYVFLLGDMIQNDRIGRVVSLDELEKVVMDQIFDVAIPLLEETFLVFAQEYEEVRVYGVPGNHGSLGRFSATKTNWDSIIYLAVKSRLANQPNIRFELAIDQFWLKVKIFKWVFLLVHGDNIKMYYSLPHYGITRHLMRWQGSLPGPKFHYACMGHFHVASSNDWNDLEYFINGCFVSDDQWVLKKLALRSSTVQWTFGVHPRKGVSWRYKLRL